MLSRHARNLHRPRLRFEERSGSVRETHLTTPAVRGSSERSLARRRTSARPCVRKGKEESPEATYLKRRRVGGEPCELSGDRVRRGSSLAIATSRRGTRSNEHKASRKSSPRDGADGRDEVRSATRSGCWHVVFTPRLLSGAASGTSSGQYYQLVFKNWSQPIP